MLWNLYEFTGRSTLGVVFGAVNGSVWEKTKCLSICIMLCGLTELLCARPYFRTFVVSKSIGLGVSLLLFIICDSLLGAEFYSDFCVLFVSLLCGFMCSLLLAASGKCPRGLFAPACFFLMLIFMMTFSFTAFAPRLGLFRDPYTGCYGVIPASFDMGAVSLSL